MRGKQLHSKNTSATGGVSNFQFNHTKSSLNTHLQSSSWLVVSENKKRTICNLIFDPRNQITILQKLKLSQEIDLISQKILYICQSLFLSSHLR